MGDYQTRGWQAWHYHMSIVILAVLFLLEQRLEHQAEIPLLSCAGCYNPIEIHSAKEGYH
jgi:hypothetical protein